MMNVKVPQRVSFVTEFPMTATGKIQKYRLRDGAVASWGSRNWRDDDCSTAGPGRWTPRG